MCVTHVLMGPLLAKPPSRPQLLRAIILGDVLRSSTHPRLSRAIILGVKVGPIFPSAIILGEVVGPHLPPTIFAAACCRSSCFAAAASIARLRSNRSCSKQQLRSSCSCSSAAGPAAPLLANLLASWGRLRRPNLRSRLPNSEAVGPAAKQQDRCEAAFPKGTPAGEASRFKKVRAYAWASPRRTLERVFFEDKPAPPACLRRRPRLRSRRPSASPKAWPRRGHPFTEGEGRPAPQAGAPAEGRRRGLRPLPQASPGAPSPEKEDERANGAEGPVRSLARRRSLRPFGRRPKHLRPPAGYIRPEGPNISGRRPGPSETRRSESEAERSSALALVRLARGAKPRPKKKAS